jgi:hypothetical protein
MELQKRTMEVSEAKGWYLIQNEKRYWTEDIIDDDTGDVTTVEHSEVVCGKGSLVNEIIQSLLEENGIKTVRVSSIPLLGNQEKHLNLWETLIKMRGGKGGDGKKCYIVTADSPSEAEKFIAEYLEVNIEATFELTKVNRLEYDQVIKLYDLEREQLDDEDSVKWYKCQIYALYDDEANAGTRCSLIQATSFEKAIRAVRLVNDRDEYSRIYNTFKLVQEMSIVDVFIPDERVSFYSDADVE